MMRAILFILLFSLLKSLTASHIAGGYFSYEFVRLVPGTNQVEYLFKARIYRDNANGNANAVLEDPLPITIFDQNLVQLPVVNVPQISFTSVIDNFDNPCIVGKEELDIQEGYYQTTLTLSRSLAYTVVFRRCCKNDVVANVPQAGVGNTFLIEIPAYDLVGENSSPIFNADPPIQLCADFDVANILDLGATDLDGDQLVYSFCAPLDYPSTSNPLQSPANPPPYPNVPFLLPQTGSNPIPSNPQLTIDPSTGALSGTPTQEGIYVVGFCVQEFRNGNLLSTTIREIQISTANCVPATTTVVPTQESFCDGLSVKYKSDSSSTDQLQKPSYKWDFGDLTTLADTSRLDSFTYTYPDTGKYEVTLIMNPGLSCADTGKLTYQVYKTLAPTLESFGKICVDGNNVNFAAAGLYEDYATFKWDFGNLASVSASSEDSVFGVVYPGQGVYPVELIVFQDICSDTVITNLSLFDNPVANFSYKDSAGCYPFPVDFTNLSNVEGNADYFWTFGDGESSTLENPTHTYRDNGLYDVGLRVITTDKCQDTVSAFVPNAIDISLDSSKNVVDFDFFPKSGCLPLTVQFSEKTFTEGGADFAWDFGNNNEAFDANPTFTYTDTGLYSIGLILFSNSKCVDTINKFIMDTLRVLPIPVSEIHASTLSSPVKEANINFDGRNSEFVESSRFLINGVEVAQTDVLDYQFKDTGHYKVDYIVTNTFGCNDTSSAEVFVFDEFEFIIPNIFSPNGDGVNETFAMRACGVYEYDIEIFNRLGEKVFRSNSMNINWDGRIRGRTASSGVYFYTIRIKDFRGEYLNYSGSLTLVGE